MATEHWGRSPDTTFEPIDSHFKIPHGVWLREATAVAVDSTDRVYVFNRGNVPLLIFDSAGNFLNRWGNSTPGLGTETIPSTGDTMPEINRWQGSEFVRPHAITIDHEDNLWLVDDDANMITKCDKDGNRIMMILPEGVILTKSTDMDAMKGKGATPPSRGSGRMFNRPTDIVVHSGTPLHFQYKIIMFNAKFSISHTNFFFVFIRNRRAVRDRRLREQRCPPAQPRR